MISDSLKNEILDGFEFFKKMQGKEYSTTDLEIKKRLSSFRENLITFTDDIFKNFKNNGNGKWLKADGKTIASYLWNRYKPHDYDKNNLVIYFCAAANTGLFFIGIGLIDDKLNEYEQNKEKEIYNFLEEECRKIEFDGFKKSGFDNADGRCFAIKNL